MRISRMLPAAFFVLTTALQAGDVADVSNPKVEPGKVNWHADFDTALAKAEKSGKPVLLFQMMGNLDEAFT